MDSDQPPVQSIPEWIIGSPEGVIDGPPGYFVIDRITGLWYRKTTPIGTKTGWSVAGGSGGGSFTSGSGSPEGVQVGSPGARYLDDTSGTFWTKATGIGTTGWRVG
jgi:hypothetical protein